MRGLADFSFDFVDILSDGRFFTFTSDNILRIWSHKGDFLTEYPRYQLLAKDSVVWKRILNEERQSRGFGLDSYLGNYASIGGELKPFSWHAQSKCTGNFLYDDGRAIVSQDNGQVSFLRTYLGNHRVTLDELEGTVLIQTA